MTAPRLVEQWTCAGRRRAAGSKRLSTAWVDAQGRQRLYAKVTGVVGGQYEVSVQHAGDTATVYGRPPFIRPADREPAEVGGWEVGFRREVAEPERVVGGDSREPDRRGYGAECDPGREGPSEESVAAVVALRGGRRDAAPGRPS